jgi:hypothetical protein
MRVSLVMMTAGLMVMLSASRGVAQEHERHDDHGTTAAGGHDHGTEQDEEAIKIEANVAKLSLEDRELALAQRFCVVMTDMPLGAMGMPIKVDVNGEAVFVCCKGCQKKAIADPAKTLAAVKKLRDAVQEERTIAENMAKLSPEDRERATAQGFCAVMVDHPLGTMGAPVKITVGSEEVFLCCKGCADKALADPDKTIAAVKSLKEKVQAAADKNAAFAKLSPADRRLAEAQGFCAVMADSSLGSMGVPIKVMVKDQPVFLCCAGCKRKALANPDQTLATVEKLKAQVATGTDH